MSRAGYSALVNEDPDGPSSDRLTETTSLRHQANRIQPKKVYVFGDGTVVDDFDDTLELTEITQRTGNQKSYKSTGASHSNADDTIIKEIPLVRDDTLHSLSIRFRCPVSEIKRVNGLITEQQFYACKTIKIPIRSHQHLLQQELEKVAQEREATGGAFPLKPTYCAGDIVSSETSDEEAGVRANGTYVEDMLTPHSDPDDMESIALLDLKYSEQRQKKFQNSKRDKKKFDKIISKKDDELREIMEKVQKQSQALDEVTAVLRTPPSLLGPQPPRRSCNALTPSWGAVLVGFAVLVVVLVLILTAEYVFNRYGYNEPSSQTNTDGTG